MNLSAVFNGTLTAVNGYNNTVILKCGAGAPSTCVVSPASATPSNSGTAFSVTVSSGVSQAYSFNIVGVGSDSATITHSATVNFTALPNQSFDFTMSLAPSSASVKAGQSTNFALDVSPTIATFPNSVSLACSKLPALTTCTFNPAQVASGSGDSVVTLTMATTAALPAALKFALSMFLVSLPLATVFLAVNNRPDTRNKRRAKTAMIFVLLLSCLSCGGGLQGNGGGGGGSGSPGTPTGTYNITITATSGTVAHSTPLALTVTP